MPEKVERPDDPDRCKCSTVTDQCRNKRLPNSEYCISHSAGEGVRDKTSKRKYQIEVYKQRYQAFAEDADIKCLRDEVAIARMTLEAVHAQCRSATDIFTHSNKIQQMLDQINRLVVSCHKLEKSSGVLVDKGAIIQFAGLVVGIISEHVEDADVIEAISQKILEKLAGLDMVDGE